LNEHATAAIAGERPPLPLGVADAVPIRIGNEVVGVVAVLGDTRLRVEHRAWLEAAAAAAAVTALMRGAANGDPDESGRALLQALAAEAPADLEGLLDWARHLGVELGAGAVAIAAAGVDGPEANMAADAEELPPPPGGLLAVVESGRGPRVLCLLPLAPGTGESALDAVAVELSARGLTMAHSSPRRDPAALHEALREAELLLELTCDPNRFLDGQEETYRLLIGVLLRNPDELDQLRERTISPLEAYDAEHDTDLVATLQAFLSHHGSTTETADAMHLHRHTVGYRLTRIQEVSGLSPYETDGRERLGLGLKAHHIIEASRRELRE
jgi:hypothetical protein